jgi:DNA-binding LacI/PurR family transcriptional regulator
MSRARDNLARTTHHARSGDHSIADIARVSQVSVSTVSRILNNRPDVSEATRRRVLGVIRRLGYSPHPHAQRLASGTSDTIALVHPITGAADYVLLDFILGASAVAEEQRFFFNLVTRPLSRNELRSIYRSRQADGVILMQICLSDWRVDQLRRAGLPFVMIGRTADCDDLCYVDPDFHAAVTTVMDHLTGLGHRRIGYLRHPQAPIDEGYGPAVRQAEAYSRYVKDRGLPSLVEQTDFSYAGSYEATRALLKEEPMMTAAVSPSGDGVAGIIEAARHSGRRVPEEFSVVSSSCAERAAMSMLPALTSVNMECNLMGAIAARMLIRLLKDRSYNPEQILRPPVFVVRSSTAPVSG